MAIAKCECGFLKKVAEDHVGKKAKCPKCKKSITIISEQEADVSREESGKNSKTDWHFSLNGKRLGPYPEEKIVELIDQKKINDQALVWNQSLPEWINVMNSQFADLIRDPKEPPPLAGDDVNNTIVWFLAFAIIIGIFIEGLISGLTGIPQGFLFFITLFVNIFLCSKDEKKLKEAGYDTSDMGSVWFVPVYLFKRAKKLGHNYAYFIVWCVIFGLYLLD